MFLLIRNLASCSTFFLRFVFLPMYGESTFVTTKNNLLEIWHIYLIMQLMLDSFITEQPHTETQIFILVSSLTIFKCVSFLVVLIFLRVLNVYIVFFYVDLYRSVYSRPLHVEHGWNYKECRPIILKHFNTPFSLLNSARLRNIY